MRVRELLAANAFCLLALAVAACGRVEQTLGEYSLPDAPEQPPVQPWRPDRPSPVAGESGSASMPFADAGLTTPIFEDPPFSDPDSTAGAAGSNAIVPLPPPMLLDAGTPPPANEPMEPPSACMVEVVETERRRLDMYLMVDNNSTLPVSGAWEDVSSGLQRYVFDQRSKGTGVGIRYFGSGCEIAEYARPTVNVELLPRNALPIINSTLTRRWTASPMLPALQGAIQHQQERAKNFPEWKQVVVLISDALTQDLTCLYTPQAVAEAARDGMEEYGIETHVIGVGVTTSLIAPLDELITRLGAYDTIAEAGGSEDAVITDITDDGDAFNEALQQVRRKAAPCEFRAPPSIANDKFGVARYPAKSENLPGTELQRFNSERACASNQGWYYATESAPTPVALCPATCSWLRQSDDRKIATLVPCDDAP